MSRVLVVPLYKKTLKSFVSILDYEIFHMGLVNLVKTTVVVDYTIENTAVIIIKRLKNISMKIELSMLASSLGLPGGASWKGGQIA